MIEKAKQRVLDAGVSESEINSTISYAQALGASEDWLAWHLNHMAIDAERQLAIQFKRHQYMSQFFE